MLRHIPILVIALLLLTGSSPGQDAKIAEADGAVEAAREALRTAEKDLASRFSLLQSDFQFIRSARWGRLRGPVLEAVAAATAARNADPNADVAGLLAGGLEKARLLAPVTIRLLSEEIAGLLEADPAADPAGALDTALAGLFSADTFLECWPGVVERLDAARALRGAHAALEKAVAARKALEVPVGDPGAPPGMVLVPRGRFKFGPSTGWDDDLKAARITNKEKSVNLPGFFIDIHEVNNAAFLRFLSSLSDKSKVREYLPEGFTVASDGTVSGPEGKDALPAVGVTLMAAVAYAESVGKRLPTEEEWEKAARGEDERAYPWGAEFDETAPNWRGRKLGGPAPVGTHPKDVGPYGTLDMGGNVSELTMTLDGRRPFKGRLKADDTVVTRGGNFEEGKDAVRATYRWVLAADTGRSRAVGFRCVMSEKDYSPK